MVDLEYDPSSLCGPVDPGVVRYLTERRGKKLDASYLRHVQKYHGGIPGKQYFDAEDGTTYRVGRFLTLVDDESRLEPPARPSWEYPGQDARVDWGVLTLISQEGPSCRNLFSGEKLLPFAALYWGPHHPDGMSLTDGNVNLVCFFYESPRRRPRVVVWLAHAAQKEYFRWEDALKASGWKKEEEVRYADFTVPVAPGFAAFLKLLRREP